MQNKINNFHNSKSESDEEILDWEKEAEAIIQDVKDHVKEIFVSPILQSNNYEIFINLKTLENNKYCIRASGTGFQVTGEDYDNSIQLNTQEGYVYETPYALLTVISAGYVQSFAQKLSDQLRKSLIYKKNNDVENQNDE